MRKMRNSIRKKRTGRRAACLYGIVSALAAAVCAACLAGCGQKQTEVPKLLEPAGTQYNTCTVQYGELADETLYDAWMIPESAELCTELSGVVEYFEVIPGDKVEKGELLLALADHSEEIATLEEELVRLSGEKERLEGALGEIVRENPGGREKGQEELSFRRIRAEYTYQIGVLDAEIRAAQQRIAGWKEEDERGRIYAPFSGIITAVKEAGEGDWITAYETCLVVADPGNISACTEYIAPEAFGEGSEIRMLQNGKAYAAEYTAATEEEYRNAVYKGYALTGRFESGTDAECGEYAAVIIRGNQTGEVLSVREEAVFRSGAQEYVYRLEAGRRVLTEVETGRRAGGMAEILSGLSEGDEVCLSGTGAASEEASGNGTNTGRTAEAEIGTFVQSFETQRAERIAVKSDEIRTPGTAGTLLSFSVRQGDEVRKGDVIAVIQPEISAAVLREKELAYEAVVRETKRARELGEGAEQAEQREKQARKELDDYRALEQEIAVKAPADGVLSKLADVREGDHMNAKAFLAEITRKEPWLIRVVDTGGILRFGMEVSVINTRGGTEESYTGRVVSLYPERAGGTAEYSLVRLEGLKEEPDWGTITIKADIKRMENALLIPSRAVKREAGRAYVSVLQDGVPEWAYIVPAADNKETVWVLRGLSEGDRVLY